MNQEKRQGKSGNLQRRIDKILINYALCLLAEIPTTIKKRGDGGRRDKRKKKERERETKRNENGGLGDQ